MGNFILVMIVGFVFGFIWNLLGDINSEAASIACRIGFAVLVFFKLGWLLL